MSHFDHSFRNQKRKRENDDFVDPSTDKCPICQQYIPLIGMVPHLKNCIIEYERKYNLPHTCPCNQQEKQVFLLQSPSTSMQSPSSSMQPTSAAIQPTSMISQYPSPPSNYPSKPSPPPPSNYPPRPPSPPAQYSSANGTSVPLPSSNERPQPPPLKTNNPPSPVVKDPSSTTTVNSMYNLIFF